MKKILFVIHSLKNKGGIERVAIELANSLCQFYDVTILCQIAHKTPYFVDSRVKIIYIDAKGLFLLFRFKQYMESNYFDFILVHSMTKLTTGLLALGFRHNNFNTLEHTSFLLTKNKILILLKKILYKYIKTIIVLTNSDKIEYDKFHDNVVVIRNSSPFKIKKNKIKTSNKIIAVGSLNKIKGFERLIKAWAIIEKNSKNFNIEIYGKGEENKTLNNLIKKLKLKKIFLKGNIEDIEDIYKESSFFVMTSYYEGLPMVLIEAQTFGLPIVAFNCPFGPSEIVNNKYDGYLVKNNDINEFSNKMKFLIDNPDIIEKFSNNALKSAERFTKDKIILQWIKLIENGKIK